MPRYYITFKAVRNSRAMEGDAFISTEGTMENEQVLRSVKFYLQNETSAGVVILTDWTEVEPMEPPTNAIDVMVTE